jgi:hypothetical protein
MNKILITLISFLIADWVFAGMTYSGCNRSDKRTLQSIHTDLVEELKDLNQRVDGVPQYHLGYIKGQYVYPQDRVPAKKFPDPNTVYRTFHNKVKNVVSKMNSTAKKGYKYTCHKASQKRCKNGSVYAYVLFILDWSYGGINICPTFFEKSKDEMLDTLLHELSHYAASTEHYMGTIMTPEGMIESANDAYLYGRMRASSLEKFFKFNSWGHMWHKKEE